VCQYTVILNQRIFVIFPDRLGRHDPLYVTKSPYSNFG